MKITYVNFDVNSKKLIINIKEYPGNSWSFDINEIADIKDFKVKLLAKEQEVKKHKQLIQEIQALIDSKTEMK